MKNLALLPFFLCLSFFTQTILSNTFYSEGRLGLLFKAYFPLNTWKGNNIDLSFYSLTPMAFPTDLTVCSNGNGTGTFNLLSANNTVNGGTGYTVLWWADAAGTIPIANPNSYTSLPGTVWATVDDGTCQSAPVEVTLHIYPEVNSSNTSFIPDVTSGCAPYDVNVYVTLPPGAFDMIANFTTASYNYMLFYFQSSNGLVLSGTITESATYYIHTLTDQYGCTYILPDPDTIYFEVLNDPEITVLPNPSVCEGSSIDLSTLASTSTGLPITFHSDNPPTPTNELPSTTVSPMVATTYYAYVDGPANCFATEPITIMVEEPELLVLGTDQVCGDVTTYNLTALIDPAFPMGVWSGEGVIGNNFDATGLSGLIPLTFTPDPGICALLSNTFIEVVPISSPVLSSANLCSNDPVFPLAALADPLYPDGVWSGQGVSGNFFEPFGLSGNITLTFAPSDPCLETTTTQVFVTPTVSMDLGTDEICENNGLYDLSQLIDPQYQTGTWSGTGVSGNYFDPSGLGSGNYSLTFTSDQDCVMPGATFVLVNETPQPNLMADDICEGSEVYDLTGLQDPLFPTGTWSGPGVSGNQFDPAGQSGVVSLSFTPTDPCSQAGNTTLSINGAPTVDNVLQTCSPDNLTYTVSFEINGGDQTTYVVDGTPSNGLFSSPPIDSDSTYSFQVDDVFSCGPVTVSGVFNCGCLTSSGTVDLAGSPYLLCSDDTLTATFNGDANLESGDLLIFILHDLPGQQLGNVYSISDLPVFGFPANGIFGETYYISAVAGSDAGAGNIDFSDGCLSVSVGVPVVFYEPGLSIGNGGEICEGECFDLEISFTGVPPFELIFQIMAPDSTFNETFPSSQENNFLSICPNDYGVMGGEMEILPISFNDANCGNLLSTTSATFTINPNSVTEVDQTLCSGETLTVNGAIYNEINPSGTEIIANGNAFGCDSVINVDLIFLPNVEFEINQTLCVGSSLTVNGTVYDESNPNGTEIFPNGSAAGCDSTVNVSLNFTQTVTETINETLCAGNSITVNGTVYDESNPAGTELIPNGSVNGCDSLIEVNLAFVNAVVFDLLQTLCLGESITVNGTEYNEINPSGTELLTAVNGCDSVVNVNLVFHDAVTFDLLQTLCMGESMVVNGTVYDEGHPMGTETITGGSFLGCDSVILVNLSFDPVPIELFSQTLCSGGSVVINGNTYDESNPFGFELLPNAAVNGCDSLVTIDLTFTDQVAFDLSQTLCAGESIMVNNEVYDENNPIGMEIITGGSYLGCDSVVNVSLSFNQPTFGFIAGTFCLNESMVVNGTIYNASNPVGTETILNGNYLGCDSVITIDMVFFAPAIGNFTEIYCAGEMVVINGNTYNETNPSGTELLTGASSFGCDSIVNVSLSFYDEVVQDLALVLCEGESVIINGTVYDEANPSGAEVFLGGSMLGCDSTLIVQVDFLPAVFAEINGELLVGDSLSIAGTVFDEINPSGVVVIENGAANGCDSIINVALDFVYEQLQVNINSMSPTCFDNADGQILIENISGGNGGYLVGLNGSAVNLITSFPYVIDNLSAGIYEIMIQDSAGNEVGQMITLSQPPGPFLELGSNLEINLGENVAIHAQTNVLPTLISWEPTTFLSCTNCLDPVAEQPTESISYTLYIEDENGCHASDDIAIFVRKTRDVFVPNAFSPNGDGINDFLTVFAGKDVETVNVFKIFDRWGGHVFEAFNFPPNRPEYGWDGQHNGQPVGNGVFAFFAEVRFLDGQMGFFKGDVVVIK